MAQIGMPVRYFETASGAARPALVVTINGSGDPSAVVYFDAFNSPQWQTSASGLVHDDTGATNNSWGGITFNASTTVTSGE